MNIIDSNIAYTLEDSNNTEPYDQMQIPDISEEAELKEISGTQQSTQVCRKLKYLEDSIYRAIMLDIIELKTYLEAVGDQIYGKQWESAIRDELDSLNANGTWHLEDLPYRHRPITLK